MKTRAKKCGVFVALAAVLLLSAALVTTCVESISPDGLAIPQWEDPFVNFQPPEGMGYIRLNIASDESNARTVLPTGSTLASIVEFTVHVGTGTTLAQHGGRIAVGNISDPITLNQATYNVEVRGYADSSNKVVAVGSLSGVVISGSPNSKTVTLHEVYDSAGGATGTFSWTFTLPSATADVVDSATMTVSNWSSPGNTIPPGLVGVDVKTAPTSVGIAIPSGYYYVDVTLVKASHLTQTYREILHVATGLTSNWTKSFSALNKNVYVITYADSDGVGTADTDSGYAHGSTITDAPSTYTWGGSGTYGIEGWYRTRTGSAPPYTVSNPWTFGAAGTGTKVISDITLYPNWIEVTTGQLVISIDATFEIGHEEPTFTFGGTGVSGSTVTYSQANYYAAGAHSLSITLGGTGITGLRASFYYNVANVQTLIPLTPVAGVITIDLDTYEDLLVPGPHYITIYGTVGEDDAEYSTTLILDVSL